MEYFVLKIKILLRKAFKPLPDVLDDVVGCNRHLVFYGADDDAQELLLRENIDWPYQQRKSQTEMMIINGFLTLTW